MHSLRTRILSLTVLITVLAVTVISLLSVVFIRNTVKNNVVKQTQVAASVNVTQTAISKWEHGSRPLRKYNRFLCSVLDCTAVELEAAIKETVRRN